MKNKGFRTLWIAQFISIFGDYLSLFATISLVTFKFHGTAVQVVAINVAYIMPLALAGPLAGVFVDRWAIKNVMIVSDLVRAALILLLTQAHNVVAICVIFLLLNVFSCFFTPALAVSMKCLIPRDNLLSANALMNQAFYIVRMISPLIAGVLIAWIGEKICFYMDSASFIASGALVSTLVINRAAETGKQDVPRVIQDMIGGIRFIFSHRALTFVFIAMAVAVFILSSFSPLMSIYIRDFLGASPLILGIVVSMAGTGLITGSFLLMRRGSAASFALWVSLGMALLGAGAATLVAFNNVATSSLGSFLMGFAVSLVLVPSRTMLQQETPADMLGRVSSSFMSLTAMAQMLGLLLSGYLAQKLGIKAVFFGSAAALIVISVGGWRTMRPSSSISTAPQAN